MVTDDYDAHENNETDNRKHQKTNSEVNIR
jgi:hypothetical protein